MQGYSRFVKITLLNFVAVRPIMNASSKLKFYLMTVLFDTVQERFEKSEVR